MKLTPLPDGRIAIMYTPEEDAVLERVAAARGIGSRDIATDIYRQLTRASAPDVVAALANLGPPR